jgi:hypothetical protein
LKKIRQSLYLALAILCALSIPAIVHAPADTIPPVIGTPVFQPSSPAPSDAVTVSVNVTDNRAVKNVTIVYTTDNWSSVNTTVVASYNATSNVAKAQIPAQANGGHVEFYIVAFDTSGNKSVNKNSGNYFTYNIPAPAFPAATSTWIIAGVLVAALGIFAMVFVRTVMKPAPPKQSKTNNS